MSAEVEEMSESEPDGAADCPPCEGGSPLKRLLGELGHTHELSGREVDVVTAAFRGLDTKATACELKLSPKTVDEYWRRVYRKLRLNSRLAVVAYLQTLVSPRNSG